VRRRILIADRDAAFGATLKQAIESGGLYQVTVTSSAAVALDVQAAAPFDLAIIDPGLEDLPGPDLIYALRRRQPDLRIIVSPRGQTFDLDELVSLDVQGVLRRPIAFADLPAVLAAAMARPVASAKPPHSESVTQAGRQLRALTLEAGATAALLTETGQLVAYTGDLPREEVEALVTLVTEGWREGAAAPPGTQAQVRFIRLKPDGPDYLLYSTSVLNSAVLSLVFQADTPLGTIRNQARRILESLRHPTVSREPWAAGGQAAVPPPPAGERPAAGPEVAERLPEETPAAPSRPAEEPVPGLGRVAVGPEYELPGEPSTLYAPRPAQQAADPLANARRAGYAIHDLSYVLVWLPRFATTRLVGDLAGRLAELIREIAASYEWEVRHLEVQPDYVQVIVAPGPPDAPATLVNTFKRMTAQTLFAEFPRLRQQHLAGQLWANGYLAIAGPTPLSPEQVRRYITYARQDRL